MAARSSQEEQKRRRRKRLVRGLMLGGAAIGIPAIANALIARRSRGLPAPMWGREHRYAWTYGEVSFQDLGRGRPLLLLHSFGPGHDSEEWRETGERLATSRRVFALDLLGWGRSHKPRIAYDGELYIQLISDFIQDVIGEACVMVCAGLSAAYAVQLAVDRPELVRGLALVTPSGIEFHADEPDLKDALVHRLLRLPVLGTSALNLFTSRTAMQQYVRRELFRSPELADPELVEHYHQSSRQQGSHAPLAAYLSGYLNHRIDGTLGRLGVPLWIAWGRFSTAPPVEAADLWLQQQPDAGLEIFEDCANFPHLEAPEGFSRRLERFLSRLDD